MLGLRFVRRLSLVAANGGHSSSRCGDHSSSRCTGLSLSRPLLLRGTGSRRAGSVVVAHGPSCSAACGIFPDQGSNPCPLHWQADSQPLHHQGSPFAHFLFGLFVLSSCKCSLYIRDTSFLSDIQLADIFSYPVSCFFHFLNGLVCITKLVIFMKSI